MKVFKAFLLLCGIGLSLSFNVDTSKGATYKTIRPYQIEANEAINYPIFFGYQFQIQQTSSLNILYAGAPRYKKLGEPLPQPGVPRALNIGSLMTCRFRNSSESSNIRCVSKTLPGPPGAERGDSYGISLNYNHANSILLACSPPKLQKCVFQSERQYNVPGYCYRSKNQGSTWEQDPKTFDLRCPTVARDIIFLLDGSDSVGEANFNTAKDWVIRLVRNFNINDGSTKVGVIQYSHFVRGVPLLNQQYFITEVSLGQYTSQEAFANAVRRIQLIAFDTYTAAALLYTLDEFQRSTRFVNQDTAKVLILLTDGKSTDATNLQGSAQRVRSQGIITFAVGVGNAQVDELGIIASGNPDSRRRVFFVQNFDALDEITQRLTNEISAVSLEGVQVGDRGDSHNRLNFGEYGFSIDWSERRTGGVFLGAVGAYDWSGTIVKYDSSDDQTPDIPGFEEVRRVLPDRTKISYLGYAVTSGFFNGGLDEYVAIGAPRNQLLGAVVVYEPVPGNPNFTNANTIYPQANLSKQLGSYFGGVLLSVDVNNDQRDDLFVGAPLYIGSNYDDGRVFAYISGTSNNPRLWARSTYTPTMLSGGPMDQGGRFGTAMASAGDLNDDGYNDVVIGAPYLDGNQGAIYIFHGRSTGIDPEPKQVIKAASLNMNLQYFGIALEGGQDLDGNDYPDIAVGAPKSDSVIIFRSRPVVKFDNTFRFNLDQIPIFDCFTKENRNCVSLRACLTYSGKEVESTIPVTFRINLDTEISTRENKRVEFREEDIPSYTINRELTLSVEENSCFDYEVYIKRKISDYSTPILATFSYELSPAHSEKALSSVLDPTIPSEEMASTEFQRDCGSDNICNYDLVLEATDTLPPATLQINGRETDLTNEGTTLVVSEQTASTPIVVKANLTNTNEFAFDVRVTISFNYLLTWTTLFNVQSSNKNSSAPCIYDSQLDVNEEPYKSKTLIYRYSSELGSIMPDGEWCYFEFNLSSSLLRTSGSDTELNITLLASTLNAGERENDRNEGNNVESLTAPIRYRADASFASPRVETIVPFNYTDQNKTIVSVKQIGQNTSDIQMQYQISGSGHSTIPFSTMKFTFPFTIPGTTDFHLLYLYKYDCTSDSGDAGCFCDQSVVNPYGLIEDYPSENITGLNEASLIANPERINASVTYNCSDPNNLPAGVCQTFTCNVTNLASSETIRFRVYFRLWSQSLNLVRNETLVTLHSGFEYSTAGSGALITDNGESDISYNSSIKTFARLFTPPVAISDANDIWIYIVATIGGLLLLILIIIVLWKTGFFKSKYAEKKEALAWTDPNQ